MELLLDSNEKRVLKAGDVGVQRATAHSWSNTSKTESARVFFVLIGCEKLVVDSHELGDDYPGGKVGENLLRLRVHSSWNQGLGSRG